MPYVTIWCLASDITYKATVPEVVTFGFCSLNKDKKNFGNCDSRLESSM